VTNHPGAANSRITGFFWFGSTPQRFGYSAAVADQRSYQLNRNAFLLHI
jgi:hypothetical protein